MLPFDRLSVLYQMLEMSGFHMNQTFWTWLISLGLAPSMRRQSFKEAKTKWLSAICLPADLYMRFGDWWDT